MQQQLTIGFITGSHGVRGELKVRSTSGEMEHFLKLGSVTVRQKGQDDRELQVRSVRGKPDAIILALEGINDPETARKLRGSELIVPRDAAAPLGTNEYYVADLVGCCIQYLGTTVGRVVSVWNNGLHDMFDIELNEGGQRVVPFLDKFIGAVDPDAGYIELKLEWILE
ncbi:ribosome maturation factor RimM [Spirochaeta africana]|uniref:Ribosome maturation factor RimM n=1 Tax=Spirochaeta africana (strain ATCC 700263 / DSM 8902 / Z-7692) TaxID=889378 RepID=H9UIE9_SPIAZ|nr:ribosome maturation factor RimM [Spirochaeta africana]AFG37292.1 16S rRNA processing protein RimM [Spirochaeta africana DSM 8902]